MDGYKKSKKESEGIELKEEVQWTQARVEDERKEECWEVRRCRDGNDDGRQKCDV